MSVVDDLRRLDPERMPAQPNDLVLEHALVLRSLPLILRLYDAVTDWVVSSAVGGDADRELLAAWEAMREG